ncbi:hypothetical protein PInf_010983 [Phytophthora infestans]|nr:hypothetical protein PInf_010983 [Phytophthora infestans]
MDVQHDVALNMEKTSEAAAAPSRILFLDGVRGLAALLVVTQHSHEYMQDLNLGACAVDAFFVLSSFLLTMLFMKKSMKLLAHGATYRKWTFTLADYFSKRFFRIYPLFALVATVRWMLPHDVKRGLFRVEKPESFDLYRVLTFDFDQRFFVFWTLPLEISYYLFIPVFVLAVLKLRSYWWIPFSSAYCWVMYEGWYTFRWSHMGLAPHFPTFLAGSLAAVIFVKLDMWMKMNSVQLRPPLIYAIRTFECTAIALLLSLSFRGLFFYWIHANIAPQTAGFPFISRNMLLENLPDERYWDSDIDRLDADSSGSDTIDEEDDDMYAKEERHFADSFLNSIGGHDSVLAGDIIGPALKDLGTTGWHDPETPNVMQYLQTPYTPVPSSDEYPDLMGERGGPTEEALKRGASPIALFFMFIPVALWQHIAERRDELDAQYNKKRTRQDEMYAKSSIR